MKFKAEHLVVNPENPFEFDCLQREPSIKALTGFIDSINGPFVLALDSPWGTGKTAFIKMWQAYLEKQNHTTLYFNAWESDFSTDPMVAFVAEISSLMEKSQKNNGSYKPHLAKARKIATVLAKRALPAAIRIGTAGILNLSDLTEEALGNVAADGVEDAIDLYTAEKNLRKQFHEALNATIASLKESKKRPTLIIFVDEIDRCRPTYAIDLLERIKHLFNIENVIFIVALDKNQLSVSLKGVYGEGLNTNEYLRRFIDVEFNLPSIDTKSFTTNLISKFSFDEYFANKKGELAYDFENFKDVFNELAFIYNLTLRQMEHCFTRIALALNPTPANHYLHPIPLTILTVLNIAQNSLYKDFVFGKGTATDVIDNLISNSSGEGFKSSHLGKLIESCIIALKIDFQRETNNEVDFYKTEAGNSSNPKLQSRAREMLEYIQSFRKYAHKGLNIKLLSNKIELAAQLSD